MRRMTRHRAKVNWTCVVVLASFGAEAAGHLAKALS